MPFELEINTHSFADFDLDDELLDILAQLGFEHPTAVQRQAIPVALTGQDLLVSAATGSGKTLAFLLPSLQRLLDSNRPTSAIGILILAPTRELAKQIFEQCRQLNPMTGLTAALVTGGEDFKRQHAALQRHADIIIATPGRLLELQTQDAGDFSQLQVLILDEADRMLDMGFSDDVLSIVELCNPNRQILLCSATLNHAGVIKMAERLLKNPQTIALNSLHEGHANIGQQIILADDHEHKLKLLTWLLQHENYDKSLIFTNTRDKAIDLHGPLQNQGLRVGLLHGEMEPSERKRVMTLFQNGVINILLATDLAARGLDIKNIDLIINFDVPPTAIAHTHRIGRTGRADAKGLAITLVAGSEWNLMASIQRYLRQSFTQRSLEGLAGRFQGPKKVKSSGKAVSSKKKTVTAKKKPAEKIKIRQRDQKNIGKRRKPSQPAE